VYAIDSDGGNLRALTALNEDQPAALYAPDGRYILFLGTYGLYVMRSDGMQLQRLRSEGGHGTLDLLP
jgi:Tol biopolymer transport system component